MVELAKPEFTSELEFRDPEFEKSSINMSIFQGVQGPQKEQSACGGSKMAR